MEQTPNYDKLLKMSKEELREILPTLNIEEVKELTRRMNEYINSPEAREVMGRASIIITGEPLD